MTRSFVETTYFGKNRIVTFMRINGIHGMLRNGTGDTGYDVMVLFRSVFGPGIHGDLIALVLVRPKDGMRSGKRVMTIQPKYGNSIKLVRIVPIIFRNLIIPLLMDPMDMIRGLLMLLSKQWKVKHIMIVKRK